MPVQVPPVPRGPLVEPESKSVLGNRPGGSLSAAGVDFLERLLDRVGGPGRRGVIVVQQVTVAATDLTGGSTKRLLRARQTEQWNVRELFLAGPATSFAGGDRDMAIQSGSTIYSVVPSATLLALQNARWGDTGLPYPSGFNTTDATAKGEDIVAQRSGGATDHTSGSVTVVLFLERAA